MFRLAKIFGLVTVCHAWWGAPVLRGMDETGLKPCPAFAIENVAIVDVVAGRVTSPRTVIVADGLVTEIREPPALDRFDVAVHVDGRGRYLMPGLVDMHVHLFNNSSHPPPNQWAFSLFVAKGVTAVREMNATCDEIAGAALAEGDRARRLGRAGSARGGCGVHGSPEAVRGLVIDAQAAGADFVKVFSDAGSSSWRAALEETHRQGLPVCGHIPAETTVLAAARTGQRSNEHLTQIYEACSPKEKEFLAARAGIDGEHAASVRDAQQRAVLEGFDQSSCDATGAALAATGQVQVPTLVLSYFEAHRAQEQFHHDSRWQYLRADEQARWDRILKQSATEDAELSAQCWTVSREIVKSCPRRGREFLPEQTRRCRSTIPVGHCIRNSSCWSRR